MVVSLKTDLRFPIPGQQGHGGRIIHNWSENSIRPVTVGRKNWLFNSSVDGAEASMNIYTIIEMAKLHGLNRVFCKCKFLKFADKNGEFCISVLEKVAGCPAGLPDAS